MQNTEVMTTIKLSGSLAKTFGREHQRLITTTQEAIRALCATIPGFEKYLNTSKSRGLTFSIFRGKQNIGKDDLVVPNGGREIRIVPVILGSKKAGVLQTILGAVIVAASIWMPGIGIAASNMMFAAGTAMTVGGVAQLLSPQATGLASKQSADNKA